MKIFIAPMVVFSIIILLFHSDASAQVASSNILPVYQISPLPSQDNFMSKSQHDLLPNYPHYSFLRQNGEKVDGYFLYDSINKNFVMIFYFEDSTYAFTQHFIPYNSDYFGLFIKSDVTGERYVFAERNGNGCMFPIQYLNDYWTGKFSGCAGGASIVKKTDNGWAVYVKFFTDMPDPLSQKYLIKWAYGDIESVQNNIVNKFDVFNWPQSDYARIAVLPKSEPPSIPANSGTMSINDFLYTPINFLTKGLLKSTFSCASDIMRVSTDLTNYNSTYHVARITASVSSDNPPNTLYLTIKDKDGDTIQKDSQQWGGSKDVVFLADLNKYQEGVYSAVVQYGTNGPSTAVNFAYGKSPIQNESEKGCYVYLAYDSVTRSLSILANIKDTTNSPNDRLQIFVDRNGDDVNELKQDDISYIVDKNRFGATVIESNGLWLQDLQHEKTGEGRIKILPDSYQVLINVPDVSQNFRIALEQDDDMLNGIKASRYPMGSFSSVPSTWASVDLVSASVPTFVSSKWEPDEILTKQTVNVNLILIGGSWNSTLKSKIMNKLDSTFSPIVSSEMSRAGIEYDYNYNFVSVPDKTANDLFNFMKKQAADVNPFYGGKEFQKPFGMAYWIQNNHTEWIDKSSSVYKINYKLINADKMEEYIQKNIIAQDLSFSQLNSANLIFINDGLDKINFLHNYNLQRYDTASRGYHNAVGLMGYGGNYNLYFFDLYAVPWADSFDYPILYDKKMRSYATDLLDIKSEDGYSKLISDYTNNATHLLVNPSYVYPPIYKKHYTLELIMVHKPAANIGSLNSILDYYIDQERLKSQLQTLLPYSDWDIKATLANIESKDLPDSFKKSLQNINTVTPYQNLPSYTVDVLDSKGISKVISQLPTLSSEINSQDYENLAKSSWTIPAITVISSQDRPISIDDINENGIATANVNDPAQPCCAIGVTNGMTVWSDKVSVTGLVLHEVGHTLGLMHPFMGYSSDGRFFENDYFNWYDSVMAYNSPPYGCGIWYNNYVAINDPIDKTCGESGTIFTKFERDNLARGVTSYLMKVAQSNIYITILNLEQQGQNPDTAPDSLKNAISDIELKLDQAKKLFMENDIVSDNGALNTALDAALKSGNLAQSNGIIYESPPPTKIVIPEWVKSTAHWWANGNIGDQDFVTGIQYLIKEKIINVPATSKSGTTETNIPAWIRSSAGWWSDGKISDDEFVKSLQYLIDHGILRI